VVWSAHANGEIYYDVESNSPVLKGTVTVGSPPIIRLVEDRTALVIASNGGANGGTGSGYTATAGGGVVFTGFQTSINFDPSTCCVLDSFTVWAGASNTYANQSDKMYSSAALAPATVAANAFATAEARADALLDVVTLGRTFWPFGTQSVEMWYDQGGSSDFSFVAFTNSLLEVGLSVRRSLATVHGKVMWVGTDRRIWLGQGQSGQPVSPAWVDLLLQQENLLNLTAYMYAQGGDEFYVLTSENNWTIEVALSTSTWCYRKTPGRADHAGRCALAFNDGVVFVGMDTGEICQLDLASASEPAGVLEREVITMWLGAEETRHVINQIDVTSYMGPSAGTFTMDWSEDRAVTWKGLRTITWPQPGIRRAIARAMGTSRRRQVRVRYQGATAPFEIDEFFVVVSPGG
jgi:hypothetical protein